MLPEFIKMNEIEIKSVEDMAGICRTCVDFVDSEKVNMFESRLDDLSLAEVLGELFNTKVENNFQLPQFICNRCYKLSCMAWNFRLTFLKAQDGLHKYAASNLGLTQYKNALGKDCPDPIEVIPKVSNEVPVILINPNEVYESSDDDDFSMDTDTEYDQTSVANAITTNREKQNIGEKIAVTNDNKEESSTAAVQNIAMCQYCDIAFASHRDCLDHESLHDITNPYMCNFCSLCTNSRVNLITHIKSNHDAERPFICAVCNKGFSRRPDLKKHTIVHTGLRPFTCSLCNKSFSRNTNLTKHMRIHQSVKPFVCQSCPRSYSTELELINHGRTHTEVKPFNCNRCGASFTRRDKYTIHEESHYRRDAEFLRNQGKLGGSINGGEFLSKVNLDSGISGQMENLMAPFATETRNMQQVSAATIPVGVTDNYNSLNTVNHIQQQRLSLSIKAPSKSSKNFACHHCPKTFTRERDLHRHSALHMDTLFTCKFCGCSFNRREKLTRHEAEHIQAITSFTCQLCGVNCSSDEKLITHLQQQHDTSANINKINNRSINWETIQQPKSKSVGAQFFQNEKEFPMQSQMNLGFYSETRPDI